MELLYLWIEDYKNIYRQGFNFSPLYEFEFTPDEPNKDGKIISGTLIDRINKDERKKKGNFYKDFFNVKNEDKTQKGTITNVTAIVGENGAGKSSVLDFISQIITKGYLKTECFCIVKNTISNPDYILYRSQNIKITFDNNTYYENILLKQDTSNIIELGKTLLPLYTFTYWNYLKNFNLYDNISEKFSEVNWLIDCSTNALIQRAFKNSTKDLEIYKIYLQCKFLHKYHFELFKLDSLRINIKENRFFYKKDEILDSEKEDYERNYNFYKIFNYTIFPITTQKDFINEIYKQAYIILAQIFGSYHRFQKLKSLTLHDNTKESIVTKQIIKYKEKIDEIIIKHREKTKFYDLINELADLSLPTENEVYHWFSPIYDLKKISSLIDIINTKTQFNSTDGVLSVSLRNDDFIKFFNGYLDLIASFNFFEFNFEAENQVQYLSSGEDTILFQLSALLNGQIRLSIYEEELKKQEEYCKNILILIDEGELGLHPQWQKQYLKILIDNLPKIFPNKQIQLILTSHSPFLVSDLPKENVIFLRKGRKEIDGEEKEGKCIVEKNSFQEQTFGQNIHTLFANSFFMENNGGSMGEFAKSKLLELKREIEALDITKFDKIEKMIELIGEPFLKSKLKEFYQSKKDTFFLKNPNTDEIDKEIQRLQNLKTKK